MKVNVLLDLLNISDSGFPTGSFGHSSGLEFAVQKAWVQDAEGLGAWAQGVMENSFVPLDLRAALKAWYGEGEHPDAVEFWSALNEDLASFRASRVQKRASAQVGRSFLRSVMSFYGPPYPGCSAVLDSSHPEAAEEAVQFPIAWGSVCHRLEISAQDMAGALVFSALRQMTMVAMRVIPLGQKDAFSVQTQLLRTLELPQDLSLEAAKELESFAPAYDLAGLGMENLEQRYFRS